MEFWTQLFNSDGFAAQGEGWSSAMIGLSRLANLLLFFAYLLIPSSIFRLWLLRRSHVPGSWVAWLFIIFIIASSLTHLCNVLAFYWPAQRLFLVIDIIAAMIAIPTAIMLPAVVGYIIEQPTVKDLAAVNDLLAEEAAIAQSIAAILVDLHTGTIHRATCALEQMFGCQHGALTGRHIGCLIPDRFREKHALHFVEYAKHPTAREMGQRHMQLMGRHHEGYEFPIAVSLRPLPGTTMPMVVAVVVDTRPLIVDLISGNIKED